MDEVVPFRCILVLLLFIMYCRAYSYYNIAGSTLVGDDIVRTVDVPGGIPFGERTYNQVHFSTNGLLTFEGPVWSWVPSTSTSYPLLAVYWTDLYPLGSNNAYVYYQSYDPTALSKATDDVRNFAGISSFEAKWVFVVTWLHTPFFPNAYGPRVTIQCALITDYVSTYTTYHYIDVNIGYQRHSIRIGYHDGASLSNNNPHSFNNAAYQMSLHTGNTGTKGVWFYTLATDGNDCASRPCQNGATCVDLYGDFHCNCLPGFTGKSCEIDIDECIAQPCYHGSCHNTAGSYYCSCQTGWTSQHCDTDINECLTVGICNHGVCINTDGSFHCKCSSGWSGTRCDQDIDECSVSSPCCNGGNCVNNPGSFACNCATGWTGVVCEKDVDECSGLPCNNDGVCYNSPGSYFCHCRQGFTDDHCNTDINECLAPPWCQNGGNCKDKPGYSVCECESRRGYTGRYCEQDIEECGFRDSPCHRNASCTNTPGSFVCTCTNSSKGEFCQNEKNACDFSPCENGGSCEVVNRTFTCHCPLGYTGHNCETDVDECVLDACKNNATCQNTNGSFICDCPAGFEGSNCMDDINECSSSPCLNNGLCINTYGSFVCVCQYCYNGDFCSNGPCSNITCENNGTCIAGGSSGVCQCSIGFTGESCDKDINECDLDPCPKNYTCNNTAGSFDCLFCNLTSDNCTSGMDLLCSNSPCQNDGLCLARNDSYTCVCSLGWTGNICEIAIDYCENVTCQNNGSCVSVPGNFTCACPSGYIGEFCEMDVDECLFVPCFNEGNCTNDNGSYSCTCNAKFHGLQCEQEIDHCASTPCLNNGTCRSEDGSFGCMCKKGWRGTSCEQDVDECLNNPCYGDGTCINIAGGYNCLCPPEVTGKYCEQDFDECESSPCQNGGICINLSGGFSCVCASGFNGTVCEIEIDECQQNPCDNGGTCINTIGSYHCYCGTEWSGEKCQTDVNECLLIGCSYNGTCTNTNGSFHCQCDSYYTGRYCEQDIDECVSQPGICKNGGTCENLCGSYKCHCTKGNAGYNCDGDINECLEWTIEPPCKNGGICTNTKGSFYCTCNSNWTGNVCDEDVNECRSFPCQNNGTCFNFDGGYNCTCATGFTGALCEIDINECLSHPCQNHSTCINTHGSFYCQCAPNYDGKYCEIDLCKTKSAEIVFVVDSSLSTSEEIFQQQKEYISEIVSRLTLSEEKFKVAVASYGSNTSIDVNFNSYAHNKTALLDQISKLSFVNGTTDIHNASYNVRDMLYNAASGSNQIVIFFTDGMPSDLKLALNGTGELRAHLFNVSSSSDLIFVSVGEDVRHEGLRTMSGDPRLSDIFTQTPKEAMYHVMKRLVDAKCTACYSQEMLDVMFVLDTSLRLSQETFSGSLRIINSILDHIKPFVSLGPNTTQMGAVYFSSEPYLLLQLNETYDYNSFASKLMGIVQDNRGYKNASSNVAQALNFTRYYLTSEGYGARESSRKIIVHVYTGFDSNVTESVAMTQSLTRDQITVISVGVGKDYKDDDVLSTASSAFHAYFSDYNDIDNSWELSDVELRFIGKIDSLICTDRVNS